ncbi:hypothetical protein XHC_2948 [Xanthomonas hortorum pv. carotae str. M081]|nr:hypothetical protein XHC_2948 [Xanthomonas hortorum pv. carotae str. M081]
MQGMPTHARNAKFSARDWPLYFAIYPESIDRKHHDARICFAFGLMRYADREGNAPWSQHARISCVAAVVLYEERPLLPAPPCMHQAPFSAAHVHAPPT